MASQNTTAQSGAVGSRHEGAIMNQLKTVVQFSNAFPAFTPAALRALIFKANSRVTHEGLMPGNGLIESGALVRLGRRVPAEKIGLTRLL